ncbi:MAG: ferric reductase-like transmembrane domain-containing protein [Nanoarchaeota archaeon]|nr:ferric reductase-like transmembrane domain-containing protein [Nanoarchaeota archaeon]
MKLVKLLVILGLLTAYIIPLVLVFSNFSNTASFYLRLIGLVAFVNTFVQLMLGSFRNFFKNNFNPLIVFKSHNYLGLFTLFLALVHGMVKAYSLGLLDVLMLEASLGVVLGVIALYVMIITVFTSDLKYFFKVRYDYNVWKIIHLFNYALFFLIYFHAKSIGTDFNNELMVVTSSVFLVMAVIGLIYRSYKIIKTKALAV